MILKTNGERLWNSLMEMATIGPGERGGSRRLALTDFDIEGRNLFRKWADEAGCIFRMDTMGNLFARRNGKNPEAPPIWHSCIQEGGFNGGDGQGAVKRGGSE